MQAIGCKNVSKGQVRSKTGTTPNLVSPELIPTSIFQHRTKPNSLIE